MNKRIKAAFIKELLNPRNKQTSFQLYGEGSHTYCVLGLLCKVVDPKNKTGWKQDWFPEQALLDKAGITVDEAHELSKMNDLHNMPFPYIAGYVATYM
jgi:hypothetical protein